MHLGLLSKKPFSPLHLTHGMPMKKAVVGELQQCMSLLRNFNLVMKLSSTTFCLPDFMQFCPSIRPNHYRTRENKLKIANHFNCATRRSLIR